MLLPDSNLLPAAYQKLSWPANAGHPGDRQVRKLQKSHGSQQAKGTNWVARIRGP
jgi:hypothetical protein